MRVLITGGSGLLGRYLLETLPDGVDARFTWWSTWQPWCQHQMDVTQPSQVQHVFDLARPEAVVHMASIGSVDRCERDYGVAEAVNVHGTRNVCMAAREAGARVLLTSSNAVYGGDGKAPYGPDADRCPVNVYGRMRVRAEDLVMREQGWQIVRLFLLYGWEPPGARDNWGSKAVRMLDQGKPLSVVGDVWYQPTYARHAAREVWRVLLRGYPRQAYNVAASTRATLYQFVSALADRFGHDDPELVRPVGIASFPGLAPRPKDSTYAGAELPGIGAGLEEFAREMKI